MSEVQESLGFDRQKTLQFFYETIKNNIPAEVNPEDSEVVHCATVMASYAETSSLSSSGGKFPVAMSLHEFFDVFCMDRSNFRVGPEDHVILGGQLLFLSGFFRDQFRRRHKLEWYDELGADHYERAAQGYLQVGKEADLRRAKFCRRMSDYYSFWIYTFHRIGRSLRENQVDPRVIRLD